jgi:hypothetical protein
MRVAAAREFISSLVLREEKTKEEGLWLDIANILSKPLYAGRYRPESVTAVLETCVIAKTGARMRFDELPARFGEFVALSCGGNRDDIANLLSECRKRLESSQDDRLRKFATGFPDDSNITDEWVIRVSPRGGQLATVELREGLGRAPPAVELILGHELSRVVTYERAANWGVELRQRLAVPIPEIELSSGEVEPHEIELRLHGDRIAVGKFYPSRVQILKRDWDRAHSGLPPDAYDTLNDAIQEVVLWVEKDLLAQINWELPSSEFDKAVVDWLEEMLRDSIDAVFDFDLLIELINEIGTTWDASRLFHGVSPNVLWQVILNLLNERVPLSDRAAIFGELQKLVTQVKDPEILTQKLRELVKDDLCKAFADGAGELATLLLDEPYENWLTDQIRPSHVGRVLWLDPSKALFLASTIRGQLERNFREGRRPVVVCGSILRLPLSRMLRRFDRRINVLSFNELPLGINVIPAGLVENSLPSPVQS